MSIRYLQKWLSYDVKHVKTGTFMPLWNLTAIFIFFTDVDVSKSVLGHVLHSLRKYDLATCIAALYLLFFGGGVNFCTW